MNTCRSVTLTAFLLFVPQFFGVFLLWNVVEIAVIIHHPATVATEGVLIPFTLGLLFPFLRVTCAETDARLVVKVDAYRDRLAIHCHRQRLTMLHSVNFYCT